MFDEPAWDERPGPDRPQPPSPNPAPWHDPGPPVREVPLVPGQPSPGIPVENPEREPKPERR